MMVLKVGKRSGWHDCLETAVSILESGGVVAYPTDTCYGLAADAFSARAIKKIYEIKGRAFKKPLSVMVGDKKNIGTVCLVSKDARRLIDSLMPGPLTLVLPKRKGIPSAFTAGLKNLAVRLPKFPLALELASRLGRPITATSANVSGTDETYSAQKIIKKFAKRKFRPDLVIDFGTLPRVAPSTIVDLTVKPYKILREGPVSELRIKKAMGKNAGKI